MKLATNLFMMLALFSQSLGPIQLLKPANLQEEKPAISEQIGTALVLPTQTPTSTPTPILESPAPSATVAPTETTALGIVLSFKVDPETVKPGEQFVLYWQIEGLEAIKEEAFLRFYAPPGFVLSEDVAAKTDEENGYVDLPVTETSGKLIWSVDPSASLPAMITSEFWQGKEALAKAEVVIQLREEFLVTASGGEIVGLNDQVHVIFPADALSETVAVKVGQPSAESLPVESLSGSPFEIMAVSETTKAEVSEFSKPVEIQVEYSEAGMTDEANTLLYWYDPTDGEWKLPLSQRIDTENNLIIATTDHFTVFDTYNSNWQSAETPTMEFFQTSAFTGASSFSMPIKVPAGPGPSGFQPSLSLSYSSSTVDNISSESQSSWAGMGWSLTTSFIERNGHGTNQVMDDSYQLNLNGMSMELLPGADGKYHASDENFNKVEFNIPINNDQNMSTWTIWDKSGNQYFFEQRTYFLNLVPCTDGIDFTPYVWRWSLTRVKNIYGQEMTYSHYEDTKSLNYFDCHGDPHARGATTWVYPSEIRYANNRYRIVFDRIDSTDTNHRLDYKNIWTNGAQYQAYQRALLEAVRVEQDANGDGTFETIIREYKFNYCASQSCSIFPNLVWDMGGRTPTLSSVQEYGLGGVQGGQSLPAYAFTYGDGMHLTKAENGYGGTVEYGYEETPWHESIPFLTGPSDPWRDGIFDSETPAWGNPLRYKFRSGAENWAGIPGYGGVTYASGKINVWGMVQNTSVKSYQPGRWYQMVASVRVTDGGTHSIQLGFGYKLPNGTIVDQFSPAFPLPINAYFHTVVSEPIFLPVDAIQIIPKMNSTGNNTVDWYYLFPLPTNYRVTDRTLSTSGSSYTFNYAYDGAATNNPTLSEAAAGPHPYSNAYTEFRGHSLVTETDPYNKQTVTAFNQSDQLSGRSSSVTVKDAAGNILQQSATTYASSEWESSLHLYDQDVTTLLGGTLFDPLVYRWVRTVSESKEIYGGSPNGVVATSNTAYEYESTYGNLITQTQSGTNVPTIITHTDYFPNPSAYLVGLPARTWTESGGNTLTESLNLYDGANTYDTQPTTGILTATRNWVNGALGTGNYSQTSMTRDAWGNVTAQTAWTGYGTASSAPTVGARTSTTSYDAAYHTYATSMTDPLGHITTVTYDYAKGLPLSETDPNGATTTVTYDEFGRFMSLARPSASGPSETPPSLNVSYQNSPFKVTLTQAVDTGLTFTVVRNYDGMGRQTSTVTNGVTTLYQYGYENGPLTPRVEKVSMPGSTSDFTTTKYDPLGRPDLVTAPDGTQTDYIYNGLETKVKDANLHETTSVTDILGRTLSVTPPTGPAVTFTYDPLGNMLTATRGGAEMVLTYDNAGRKLTMADPDMGFWQYNYDALGSLARQVDAKNQVACLYYDNLSRPKGKNYFVNSASCPSDPGTLNYAVEYFYDAGSNGKGRRTSMTDASGSSSWLYDSRGRVTKETKVISGTSFVTEWTLYNSADLPVTMKYPDGEIVTTQYNNNMQPINIAGTDNYVPSMTYDSAGRLLTRALGNGLTQTYGYYDWDEKVNNIGQGGRLETLVTGSLQNLAYVYDPVGNISQIANNAAGETSVYDYDALDRLTSWQLNQDTPETYEYDDDTGNLIEKNDLALDYPAANGSQATHPHAVTGAAINDVIVNAYEYDQNGNQTTREIGPDTFDLTYDAENRLVEVEKNDVTIAQFTFDGDGKRVKSVMDGETILFAGGHYEKKGSTITKYYMAGASRVAMRKYTIPQSMEVEYLLGDHLGSTSLTTDANGVKISELRYKPWGETRYEWTDPNLNTTPTYELTKYQFTGQYSYDVEFGLKYYNARWLDSAVGRFVQADSLVPSGAQGWDRYAYANNNPILYNDPSGHIGCEAGQRCPPSPSQDARDLTQWTTAAAVDIAESVEMSIIAQQNSDGGPGGKMAAWLFFANMVGDGKKYDVKDKIQGELNETIKLGNQWYEFSTPGNILYGFYGLAAGFTEQELHAGAGYAQWQDHVNEGSEIGNWSTLLDTSDDYYAVEFGFFLYQNYYANDGNLTESEFLEALSLFGNADKLAIKATPEDPYIPAEDEYEADDFYQ